MASLFRKDKIFKTFKQTLAHVSLTKMVLWGVIKKEKTWEVDIKYAIVQQYSLPRSILQPPSLLPWKLTCMDCILEFLGFWLSVWFSQWKARQEVGGNEKGRLGYISLALSLKDYLYS